MRLHRDPHHDSPEPEPPVGWDPGRDNDAEWRSIAALLKEADQPTLPTPRRFDEIRRAVMLGVAEPGRDESFVSWLRHVVLGGGFGAQLFRFACVGAVAFAAGTGVLDKAPATAHPAASGRDAAPTVAALPAPTPAGDVRPATSDGSMTIERSVLEEDGSIKTASAVTADLGWDSTMAGPDGQWRYIQGAVPVSIGGGGGASARTPDFPLPAGEIVEVMQQLRFHSLVTRDDEALTKLRRLEGLIADSLESQPGPARAEANALESFRRGEELASGRRYADALLAFHEVRTQVPGTVMAFLAQYQIARIDFDHLRDFESALDAYSVALQEYPAHFLSEQHRSRILERVELLTRNSDNNWRAVRLWQDAAAAAGPSERQRALLDIVMTSPRAPLAQDAAVQLIRQTVDPEGGVDDPQAVLDALEHAADVTRNPAFQFARGEILFRRLMEPGPACDAYEKVLQLPGSEPFVPHVMDRLERIRSAR